MAEITGETFRAAFPDALSLNVFTRSSEDRRGPFRGWGAMLVVDKQDGGIWRVAAPGETRDDALSALKAKVYG